jgi:hypothetical protein
MILVDNIVFMKEKFPLVWEAYRANEASQNEALIVKQASKIDNYPTLAVNKDNSSYFIHSRYNPEREVGAILDNHNGNEYEHVIFYGLGLGYHIAEFLERYPNLTFSIYEPVPEVFAAYLSHFHLRDLPERRLQDIMVESSPDDAKAFLDRVVKRQYKHILFLDLPSYKGIFPEEYTRFVSLFKDIAKNRRTNLATNVAFEKRWIVNSLLNFKSVLNTPNILVERAGHFKNQPAILVAAGPSLDYEIDNLKHIKENGQAYIFSVGSAVNALLSAGITPDAQCTYDPTEANQQKVFARITKENITDIPLIFGSSVGFEVLRNYPGKSLLHMITSQDTISSYLLKMDDKTKLDAVQDAPSIAVVTLQLLYKLGFNPIILVGQNLAYADNRSYAGGISYASNLSIDPAKTKGLIEVESVDGNTVYTSNMFNSMRLNMEQYIKDMNETQVINTTRGGANIKGTTYITLEELMASQALSGQIVDPHWYRIPATTYDRDYLKKQFTRLYKDYDQLAALLRAVNNVLDEIKMLKDVRNYEQIDRCWPKLDRAFNKVKRNSFYTQIIHPMNRVTYGLYFEKVSTVRFETNQSLKADTIVPSLGRAVNDSLADMETLVPIMEKIKQYFESLE